MSWKISLNFNTNKMVADVVVYFKGYARVWEPLIHKCIMSFEISDLKNIKNVEHIKIELKLNHYLNKSLVVKYSI